MKLNSIISIEGTLEVLSGLHIGAGNDSMHIGGNDNPVIKHPHTDEPYVPGSSLKGKIRSLLEWHAGLVEYNKGKPIGYKEYRSQIRDEGQRAAALNIIKLFGVSGGDQIGKEDAKEVGPTRTIFRDASLQKDWATKLIGANQLLTESKSENSINRISGVAESPRFTERVPAGAMFDFSLQVKVLDGDNQEELVNALLTGLRLLELDALGGSGSRGYGRVRFVLQGEFAQKLAAIKPFSDVA